MSKNILLIDNYDSFTYNLVHYFLSLGAKVQVLRNDAISIADISRENPSGIVISPGPCTPNEAGICLELVQTLGAKIPMLGVCLGHQTIGQVYGGKVVRAPYVMHGKTSIITHDGSGIFAGIPSPYTATRYHSLMVEEASLPECLHISARSDDGLIMGLSHRTHPVHGVQFHPESIASEYGHALLQNFLNLCGA